jgi:putative DNA primase/helicase
MNSKPKDSAARQAVVGLQRDGLADVEEKEVRWLWPNRIPLGHLTLIAGEPGLGKSFVTLDIVAKTTVTGGMWGDGVQKTVCGEALIFSAEDSASDTIKPRLVKLGADVNLVAAPRRVHEEHNGKIVKRLFNLVDDLPKLEDELKHRPTARLVIIDPVSAYLGGTESHNNAKVRGDVLGPLSILAEDYDVAIVAITHLNKGDQQGLGRISGSIAFPAAARIVWMVARDIEDKAKRLMLFGKGNLGPEMTGLAFQIIGDPANSKAQPDLQWIDGDIDETYADFQRRENQKHAGGRHNDALDEAMEFLREHLRGGKLPREEVFKAAKGEGISIPTLKRAADRLGILKPRNEGFQSGTSWELPTSLHAHA